MVWAMTELFPEAVRLTLANAINEAHDARVNKIVKVVTVAQTERCPSCEHAGVVKRGPISHCTNCGTEWGGVKANGEVHHMRRDALLK